MFEFNQKRLAVFLFCSGLVFGLATLAADKPSYELKMIQIGEKKIHVEVADTQERRSHGLMFRESLAVDHGMLFIFESEQPLSFWMKNTLIPLSIGYFDKDKKLLEALEMIPAVAGEAHPRSYPSNRPAKFALEMTKGWFQKNGIKPGARFSFVEKKK